MTFLSVFGAATAYVYTQPRIYRATAKVRIAQPRAPIILDPGAARAPSQPAQTSLGTEAKSVASIITARAAAEILRNPERLREIVHADQPGAANLSLAIDSLRASGNMDITPEAICASIQVGIEDPDVLAISVEQQDPYRAMLIANAVQKAYLEENRKYATTEATSASNFLERQVVSLKSEFDRLDRSIRRFKAVHKIREVAPEKAAAVPMMDYEHQATQAEVDLRNAEAELAATRRLLASEPPFRRVRHALNDPVATGFEQETSKAEIDLALARAQYHDTHPRVIALKDKLAALKSLAKTRPTQQMVEVEEPNLVRAALEDRIRDQGARVEGMRARTSILMTLAARKEDVPAAQQQYIELSGMEHAKEVAEKAYLGLLTQLQESKLNVARQQGTASRLDEARFPSVPIRPTPRKTLSLALIVGLLAGLGVGLMQEWMDTSVHDPEELAKRTAISSLGFIPATRDLRQAVGIAARSPRSPISEGFRAIRSNLKFAHLDAPLHSLMITSAGSGEGKSFTSANLAIVFAPAGIRTILVDADLRRPTVHRIWGFDHSPGLTNVLAGEISLEEAIRRTSVDNLTVLPGGSVPPNPSELLDSPRMIAMIDHLKERAEMVIFDTPPALVVTDAIVLSPRVDATILVIEQGRVSWRALLEIRRMIEQARGRLAGAVMNKVKAGFGNYYYYYYQYYYEYGTKKRRQAGGRRPMAKALPADSDSEET